MKSFFWALMTDRDRRAIVRPLCAVLYLVSLAYGGALVVRTLLYRWGLFRRASVPMKVISVGNLTVGGTGKTPFVIMLALLVKEALHKDVSVLIRGYGWDEQAMLKRNLGDIPVLVGEDRERSAHRAIRLYGSDTAILDDGFQHWELARNLDIVLVDARNPFGNGHLFPRGVLREEVRALGRADIIVLTKADHLTAHERDTLMHTLRAVQPTALYITACHRPRAVYDTRQRKQLPVTALAGKRVVLMSSIGDPDYFAQTVRDAGAVVVDHIIFPDHHDYTAHDVSAINARCDEHAFDLLVTTEKDIVKLNRLGLTIGSYPLVVLLISLEIIEGREEFLGRLHRLYHREAGQ